VPGVAWVRIRLHLYGGLPLPAGMLVALLLAAVLALFPALVAGGTRLLGRHLTAPFSLLLLWPALWAAGELCRARFASGFPWLSLGYSHLDTPLAGLAPVLGVIGMSWAVLLSAGLLLLAWQCRRQPGQTVAALLGLALLWGLGQGLRGHAWTEPLPERYSVAIVQGAIPQQIKWDPAYRDATIELYLRLTEPHWGTDLVVWPEAVIPAMRHEVAELLEQLRRRALASGTELALGIPVFDAGQRAYYNSLLLLGRNDASYYKRHLVPFGEYLPFAGLLRPLFDRLNIPVAGFSSGNAEAPLLRYAGGWLGALICYEDIFGHEAIEALPRARLLISVSNDGWYGDSRAAAEHLHIARARALEAGRYLVRATNTGISAFIDPRGRLLQILPKSQAGVLTAEVRPYTGATPYARWGDLPLALLALLTLAGGIGHRRAWRRRGESEHR